MEPYTNLSRQSGVSAFQIGTDNLQVQFKDGSTYVYDYSSAGSKNVEQMKTLARNGRGLNSFINKYVKDRYSRKY